MLANHPFPDCLMRQNGFYYWSVAATAVGRFQPDLPKLLGDEYCTWLTGKMCLPFFFLKLLG